MGYLVIVFQVLGIVKRKKRVTSRCTHPPLQPALRTGFVLCLFHCSYAIVAEKAAAFLLARMRDGKATFVVLGYESRNSCLLRRALTIHRVLRRLAGLVFLFGLLGAGGRLPKARRGRVYRAIYHHHCFAGRAETVTTPVGFLTREHGNLCGRNFLCGFVSLI